jgi:purine-nucleoside/S-methyl-5'-thioadenosine phosphorylase / adenosine deaminase
MEGPRPVLERVEANGVPLLTDRGAAERGMLVAFSGRSGGVSRPPYESLNLGALTDDDPDSVAANRARLAEAVGFPPGDLSWAHQIHSARVLEVTAHGRAGRGDALVRRSSGALGVLTADCVPVVLAGEDGVAAAHAGWRGLAAGVVEATVERLGGAHSAWIGPSIKACCYEVGDEVIDAFRARRLPIAGPGRVDPAGAARAALERSGLERIAVSDVCTACDRGYFSYRRDGPTGRQMGVIALATGCSPRPNLSS